MAAGLGFKDFTTGEVLTAADVDGYLMQGIWVFASNAARDAAVTAPAEGNFAFTKDTNSLWYYDGAAWVASGATGDIEGVTAGVGISGGGTSGTVTITNDMATTITASGDIVVGTGSGTYDNLPIGTTGQILTADTTVSPYKVKWAAPAGGGGMTLIQETVASNNSSIAFNSISGSYKQLLLVFGGLYHTSGGSQFSLRFNNSSSLEYDSQSWGYITNTTTQSLQDGASNVRMYYGMFGEEATSTTAYRTVTGQILIDNYASSTKHKTFYGSRAFYNAAGSTERVYHTFVGTWSNTNAITSLDIVRLQGSGNLTNIANTSIRLYGIS